MKKLLLILGLILLPNIAWGAGLNLNQGGTGWTTSLAGDLLVGTTSPFRYSRLPIGSEGTCLGVVGGTLAYTTCGAGGNPFNQWLDTTSSVSFLNVTTTGNLNVQGNSFLGNTFITSSGTEEGELNSTLLLFYNSDDPEEKKGGISYGPSTDNLIYLSVDSDFAPIPSTTHSFYGKIRSAAPGTTDPDTTFYDGSYTVYATTTGNTTLGAMHNTLTSYLNYNGANSINAFNKTFGNSLDRFGTVNGYGSGNLESNLAQRNWLTNNAIYNGTNDFTINNYNQSFVLRDGSEFNSDAELLLIDAAIHVDSVNTHNETNGTTTGKHAGIYLDNVQSNGASLYRGTMDTYGLFINNVQGNSSGETWAIKDVSEAGWYNSGSLSVLGTTTFGTSSNYTIFSSILGIPYQASYYTDEFSALVPFPVVFNTGILLASNIVSGNVASTTLTTLLPSYDEGTEKESLAIASILGRDLEVSIVGDLTIEPGKGISLGGEYRTTWPTGGGGGGGSWWATSSDSLVGYPGLAGDYSIVIGASMTTTDDIFQVIGGAYVSEDLTVAGDGTFDNISVSDTATTTQLCFASGGCVSSLSAYTSKDQNETITGAWNFNNTTTFNGLLNVLGTTTIGSYASTSDFTHAKLIVSQGDSGHTYTNNVAIVGESLATMGYPSIGVGGVAKGSDGMPAYGVAGRGIPGSSSSNGPAVGVQGLSEATHTGGSNIGIYSVASGGLLNYSFYGNAGDIYNAGNLQIAGTSNLQGTTTLGTTTIGNLKLTGLSNTVLAVDSTGKVIATSTASAPTETDPVWMAASTSYAKLDRAGAGNIFTGINEFNGARTTINGIDIEDGVVSTTYLANSAMPFLKASDGNTIGLDYNLMIYGLSDTDPSFYMGNNDSETLFRLHKSTDDFDPTADFSFIDENNNIIDSLFKINGRLNVTGTTTLDIPLGVTSGGTGYASYANGDILYASGTESLGRLSMTNASGRYLRSVVGGVPVWSSLVLPNTGSPYRLPAFTGTNVMGQLNAVGTTTQYLRGGNDTGTAIPVWTTLNQAAVLGLTTADSPLFSGIKINTSTPTAALSIQGTSTNNIFAAYTTSSRVSICALSGGAIGFGTCSPSGMVEFSGGTSQVDAYFTGGSGSSPTMFRIVGASGANYLQSATTSASGSYADLFFSSMFNASTWAVFKGATGYFGLGDTSPLYRLTVGSGEKFTVDDNGNVTSTGSMVIGTTGAAQAGCLGIMDTDKAGWTYCTTLNGVMSCSMTSCAGTATSTLLIGR